VPKKRAPHGERVRSGRGKRPAPIQVSLPPDHEQAQELATAVRPVTDGCRDALVCLGNHCVEKGLSERRRQAGDAKNT
jgi:hypothetical protein